MKKTAPGPDEIPYWVFRECAGALHLVVAHLVNLSLSMGKVPSAWKKAYITPVPKVKSKSEYTGHGDLRPHLGHPHSMSYDREVCCQEIPLACTRQFLNGRSVCIQTHW